VFNPSIKTYIRVFNVTLFHTAAAGGHCGGAGLNQRSPFGHFKQLQFLRERGTAHLGAWGGPYGSLDRRLRDALHA